MARAAKTEILTVRIQPQLLDAVKERARTAGRSLSSEVVMVLRAEIGDGERKPRRAIARISGWLSEQIAADNAKDFRKARDRASAKLTSSVRAKARRA